MSDQDTKDADVTDEETTEEEWTPPTREEYEALTNEQNRLKRVSAEAAKKAKDAERTAAAATRAQAEKDGDWQKLAEEREREAQEAAKEAADAKQQLSRYESQRRVTDAATSLNFRDPQDVYRFLSDEEQADQKLAEAALKRLKKDKPYLIAEPRRSGTDTSDEGQNSGLTPEQQHARWLASKF